jgi:hypothetical protein
MEDVCPDVNVIVNETHVGFHSSLTLPLPTCPLLDRRGRKDPERLLVLPGIGNNQLTVLLLFVFILMRVDRTLPFFTKSVRESTRLPGVL